MKIYVVRHGLTKYNKLEKINGSLVDEPLEPEGIIQAEATSATLPDDITRIYVSPMLRTKQTAEILNRKLQLDLIEHSGLREIDFGNLTHRRWVDIIEEYGPDIRADYVAQIFDFTPLKGESAEQVTARITKLLTEIKQKNPTEKVLLVTHGGILRTLYRMYRNVEIAGAENASVHEFEI